MVYTDVFETGHVESALEEMHGSAFAEIPFNDGQGNTAYWVSRDGRHVYVGVEFGGWWKVKEVRIYPAGYRTKNSTPVFKRRNLKGKQCYCALPAAVYGAFVTKDGLPRFKFGFKDGDISNCSLDNLAVSDDSLLVKNIHKHSGCYQKEFGHIVNIVSSYYPEENRLRIEDCVSDSFLRMCESRSVVGNPAGLWVNNARERMWQDKAKEKTMYMEFYPEDTSLSGGYDQPLAEVSYLPQYLYDTAELLYNGFNQREIAEILGVGQSCVAMRVAKIKRLIENEEKK